MELVWCGARNGGAGDQAASGHRPARPPSGPSWPPATRPGRAAAGARAAAGRASSCRIPAGRPSAGGARRRRRSPAPAGRPAGPRTSARSGGGGSSAPASGPGSSGHGASPIERGDDLGQRRRHPHAAPGGDVGLGGRRHRARRRRRRSSTATIGATPGTRRSVPSRPSSPMKPSPSTDAGPQLLVGDQHADGDRQVEPGARLAGAGRGQVDGDALVRPLQLARAHDGGPDPVARLPAGRVGHADDAVPGQALADVDLDADRDGRWRRAGWRTGWMRARWPSLDSMWIGGGTAADRSHDGVVVNVPRGCHGAAGAGTAAASRPSVALTRSGPSCSVLGPGRVRSVPGPAVPDSPGCCGERSDPSAASSSPSWPSGRPAATTGPVTPRRSAARSRTTATCWSPRRRRSTTSTTTSACTAASARSRRWPSSPTGPRSCSTSRRRAPSSPSDPESVQRAAARPTRRSGRRSPSQDWLVANCEVDLGPVATIVPQAAPPPGDDRGAGRLTPAAATQASGVVTATLRISPRRDLTSSHRPYSTAASAVNQRSRSESFWICSSVLPEWKAMSSAIRRLV